MNFEVPKTENEKKKILLSFLFLFLRCLAYEFMLIVYIYNDINLIKEYTQLFTESFYFHTLTFFNS